MGDDTRWPKKVRMYELYAEYREWAKEDRIKRYGFVTEGKEVTVPGVGYLEAMIVTAQGTY